MASLFFGGDSDFIDIDNDAEVLGLLAPVEEDESSSDSDVAAQGEVKAKRKVVITLSNGSDSEIELGGDGAPKPKTQFLELKAALKVGRLGDSSQES